MKYLIIEKQCVSSGGLYIIRSTKSNSVYIGETTNFKERHKQHLRLLKRGVHHNSHLQNIFNKFPNSLTFNLLKSIPKENFKDLIRLEGEQVKLFKNNNITLCNHKFYDNDTDKIRHSKETIEKISNSKKGMILVKEEGNYKSITKDEFNKGGYSGIAKGMVPVIDSLTGESFSITKEEFDNNRIRYKHTFSNTISVRHEGKNKQVTKEEFDSGVYDGVNKGKVTVKDENGYTKQVDISDLDYISGNYKHHLTEQKRVRLKNGNIVFINKSDYNPKIHLPILGRVNVIDTYTNEKMSITKEEYKNNKDRYISQQVGRFNNATKLIYLGIEYAAHELSKVLGIKVSEIPKYVIENGIDIKFKKTKNNKDKKFEDYIV